MIWLTHRKIDAHVHVPPDERTAHLLETAAKEYGLSGLKLHPANLRMDADDLRLAAEDMR